MYMPKLNMLPHSDVPETLYTVDGCHYQRMTSGSDDSTTAQLTRLSWSLGLKDVISTFTPNYIDLPHSLICCMKKTECFIWTEKYQKAFNFLKCTLTKGAVLVFPDPNKLFIMFTDTSKYAWSTVLSQSHTSILDGKSKTIQYPITYVSRMCHGSHLNRDALTKEAYLIYMAVKKPVIYLEVAIIILQRSCLKHLKCKIKKLGNQGQQLQDKIFIYLRCQEYSCTPSLDSLI